MLNKIVTVVFFLNSLLFLMSCKSVGDSNLKDIIEVAYDRAYLFKVVAVNGAELVCRFTCSKVPTKEEVSSVCNNAPMYVLKSEFDKNPRFQSDMGFMESTKAVKLRNINIQETEHLMSSVILSLDTAAGKYGDPRTVCAQNSTGELLTVEKLEDTGSRLIPDYKTTVYGYIDRYTSEVKIKYQYRFAEPFSEGLAAVENGPDPSSASYTTPGVWGYINEKGDSVVPFRYNAALSFSQGLAAVWSSNKGWGFIDKTGIERINLQYVEASSFSEDLAAVRLKSSGKWGFIDRTGAAKVDFKFDWASGFSQGYAVVAKDGGEAFRYGFIDKAGELKVPVTYHNAQAFSEGLAAVELNGKWGFIDKSGVVKVPLQFLYVQPFWGEYAEVMIDNSTFGVINKKGVLLQKYDNPYVMD